MTDDPAEPVAPVYPPPPPFQIRRLFRLSNTAGSTAVVIPLPYLRLLGWAFGDYVKVEQAGERLILSRVR